MISRSKVFSSYTLNPYLEYDEEEEVDDSEVQNEKVNDNQSDELDTESEREFREFLNDMYEIWQVFLS